MEKVPMLIPYQLQSLLSSVKKLNNKSTLEEVLDGMQQYIFKNHLFDLRNPRIVHCENDALKDVLGVEHFTLHEIRRLLLKVILPENRNDANELLFKLGSAIEEGPKRKAEMSDTECKRVCGESSGLPSNPTTLLKNSQLIDSTDDSSDEITSSLLSGSIFAVNHTYDIEYEIESESDSIQSVTDSDSEIETSVNITTVEEIIKVDSDTEFWADMSSEEFCDEYDAEIPESDKWECRTCGSRNKPLMRFCLKCWAERNGWSESHKKRRPHSRPRNKSQKKKHQVPSDNIVMKMDLCFDLPSSQEGPCSSSELLTGSQPSSQESASSFRCSQPSSLESCSSLKSSQPSSLESCSSSSSTDLCILCCEKPKNATVVHGNSGHQFSCYRCARKLLSLNKPCPICRMSIERVIHQILIT